MKRLISFLLIVSLLTGIGCIAAYAKSGPAEGAHPLSGGASVGFFDITQEKTFYVVSNNGSVVIDNTAVAGATYDSASNTLTIKDVDQPNFNLFIRYMGDDFKLDVEGVCALNAVMAFNDYGFHSQSLSIIGTGELTVNDKTKALSSPLMLDSDADDMAKLSIADSVTLDLYGAESAFSVMGTGVSSAAEAVKIDGKPVEGLKSERVTADVFDTVDGAYVEKYSFASDMGYIVKSKSDPEGFYTARYLGYNDSYMVTRLVYVPEFEMYAVDNSFSDGFWMGREMSVSALESDYTYVTDILPTEIKFASYRDYEDRGIEESRIVKEGDPETVYAGCGYWIDWNTETDPDGYTVKRLIRNDKEKIYYEDTDFEELDLTPAEFSAQGFSFATELSEEILTLDCWADPAPFDDSNWHREYDVLIKDSDSEKMYVETGTYSMNGEHGITIYKVRYDPVYDVHYFDYSDSSDDNVYYIPDGEEISDYGFTYLTGMVESPAKVKYIDRYYSFDDYCYSGIRLEKKSEPGSVYAYKTRVSYIEDNRLEDHDLVKLSYNSESGYYLFDEDSDVEYDVDIDALTAPSGDYKIVRSEQKVSYRPLSFVNFGEMKVYTDNNGKKYLSDDGHNVFTYDENNKVTIAGKEYCVMTLVGDLSTDVLNSTEHTILTDEYRYRYPDKEYHHKGTGESGSGFTLSGTATSYLSNDDDTTLVLTASDSSTVSTAVKGKSGEYSFADLKAGKYVLEVSKKNHVTREYEVDINSDTELNVVINPLGDVNSDGKTSNFDYAWAVSYCRKEKTLTDYQIKCGDVFGSGDGKLKMADAARINQHVRKEKKLY